MGSQWIESHVTALASALIAVLTAWLKRRSIASTGSSFWRSVGEFREWRTAEASWRAREEIYQQEIAILREALERLTGTALLLKQAKDQGLIRSLSASPASPASSPTSSPSLPSGPETG